MRYFAYGSNLHPARLSARVGELSLQAVGMLAGRELVFHKRGLDGSGKCHVQEGAGEVYGAVYDLEGRALERLDHFEGPGYERVLVEVETTDGPLEAFTYLARPTYLDQQMLPFVWYRSLVVAGAVHHGFPAAYVEQLASVGATRDPDRDRAEAQLRIVVP